MLLVFFTFYNDFLSRFEDNNFNLMMMFIHKNELLLSKKIIHNMQTFKNPNWTNDLSSQNSASSCSKNPLCFNIMVMLWLGIRRSAYYIMKKKKANTFPKGKYVFAFFR